MALLIAILLGLAALAFVLYPLYRQSSVADKIKPQTAPEQPDADTTETSASQQGEPRQTATADVPATTLAEQEQSARTALREVEFDYQLGNIDEPDYQELRERYMRRALLALKSRYEHEQELDDEIEAQLRELKLAQGATAQSEETHEETNH